MDRYVRVPGTLGIIESTSLISRSWLMVAIDEPKGWHQVGTAIVLSYGISYNRQHNVSNVHLHREFVMYCNVDDSKNLDQIISVNEL